MFAATPLGVALLYKNVPSWEHQVIDLINKITAWYTVVRAGERFSCPSLRFQTHCFRDGSENPSRSEAPTHKETDGGSDVVWRGAEGRLKSKCCWMQGGHTTQSPHLNFYTIQREAFYAFRVATNVEGIHQQEPQLLFLL